MASHDVSAAKLFVRRCNCGGIDNRMHRCIRKDLRSGSRFCVLSHFETEFGLRDTATYDCWLHWKVCDRCYMGCEYCFEHHLGGKQLSSIDIPGLIASLEATGMTFKLSFTGGGEPFLVPNLTEACLEITKKHYIAFNTDFCEPQVRGFLEQIDSSRVLVINASCHVEAMKKRRVLDRYIDNCQLALERGIPLGVTEVAYPALMARVPEYRELFASHGLNLVFNSYYGEWDGRTYPREYSDEELDVFQLDRSTLASFNPNSQTLCNAGSTAAVVESNGDIFPCDMIRKKIGNIYTGFKLYPRIIKCPSKTCSCPLNLYDEPLFQRSLRKDRAYVATLKPLLQANDSLNRYDWYRGLKTAYHKTRKVAGRTTE